MERLFNMTSKAQQIGIWIIAIVMTVGTIGGFIAIALGNQNQQTQLERQQEAAQKMQEEQQAAALAANEPMEGYATEAFDPASVTELAAEVLVEGTGDTVATTDTINASYFGWLSDGTMFDSSNKKDAEDTGVAFPLSGVIAGWTEGLAGQKVGSVVKLTIPADKAYGAQGSATIPANSPLQFIVKINSIEPAATES